jgi:hypothetical protein
MHEIEIPQSVVDRVLARRATLHYIDRLEARRTAHVIVDLQNGFMAPGQPAEIPAAREIVPNVNRISAALRAAGGVNVFIQNTIDAEAQLTWSNWFKRQDVERRARMNEAFAAGSFGHALWPGLDVAAGEPRARGQVQVVAVVGAPARLVERVGPAGGGIEVVHGQSVASSAVRARTRVQRKRSASSTCTSW